MLDGLLVRAPEVLVGPRGVIEPWGAAWVACTPARLAVIGDAYLDALRLWPETAERIRSGAAAAPAVVTPATGTLEERLLELLWRVALRWGEPRGDGSAAARARSTRRALSLMLAVPESELAPALAELRTDGLGATRDGALWLPAGREPLTGATARRDALRTRAAVQLALSRAVWDECAALFDALDLAVRRRDELRNALTQPTSGGALVDPDQLVEPGHVERPSRGAVRTDHDQAGRRARDARSRARSARSSP